MKNLDFLKSNIIAHKGVHNSKIPENTIPSFIKCVDKNYIIELDIHILKDKTIVVYHDFNLKRLTNKNKIIETESYEHLSKLKIKNRYTIPTLKQVMHIVNGKVPILIELKDVDNNSIFEEELVNLLDNYNGAFAIQSVNPFVVDWFIKNKKDYIVGIVIYNDTNYKLIKKYVDKVDFISINKKELPTKLKIKNKLLFGWTIKTKEEYDKYIEYCDNLICENFI